MVEFQNAAAAVDDDDDDDDAGKAYRHARVTFRFAIPTLADGSFVRECDEMRNLTYCEGGTASRRIAMNFCDRAYMHRAAVRAVTKPFQYPR